VKNQNQLKRTALK